MNAGEYCPGIRETPSYVLHFHCAHVCLVDLAEVIRRSYLHMTDKHRSDGSHRWTSASASLYIVLSSSIDRAYEMAVTNTNAVACVHQYMMSAKEKSSKLSVTEKTRIFFDREKGESDNGH